jgi:hypothetical protein
MTTYTIRVINQSGANKSYVVFMQSPVGVTPVYTNAWAVLDNIANGGWDSVSNTPEDAVQGKTLEAPPALRCLVAEGAYAPGQVIEPPQGANVATVDFTGRPETTATVTEHPDDGFSVDYG